MAWPKGKSRKPVSNEPDEKPEPEQPEIEPVSAQSGMQTSTPPIEVADIEDEILATTQPELAAQGKRFFFGNITLFNFPDGSSYHVQKAHALVTNPKIIANLIEASENKHNKIFPQE